MKSMKIAVLTGLVMGLGLMGCSNEIQAPIYGPKEVVVYNDGDTVITSTKETSEVNPSTLRVKWNSTKNVWRISQEVLKYYRQGGTMYVSGQLKVTTEVNNIDYNKTVGIRYTCNNWGSYKSSTGSWSSHNNSANTDQFLIYSESTIVPGTLVKYAIYYTVKGSTYWDNNNGANFSAQF